METTRIKLSGIWVSLMLTYLLGDVLRIFSGDFDAGQVGGMQVSQGMYLFMAILMVIPVLNVDGFLQTQRYPRHNWLGTDPDDPDLAAMRELLPKIPRGEQGRTSLYFAIAKAYDEIGDVDDEVAAERFHGFREGAVLDPGLAVPDRQRRGGHGRLQPVGRHKDPGLLQRTHAARPFQDAVGSGGPRCVGGYAGFVRCTGSVHAKSVA